MTPELHSQAHESEYNGITALRETSNIDAAEEDAVRKIVHVWRGFANGRSYPSRKDIQPRAFGNLLSNILILRVVGDCSDYEIGFVGNAHVAVLGLRKPIKLLSEMDTQLPDYARTIKPLYDRVVKYREPFLLRSSLRRTADALSNFSSESAFLPLGPNDKLVDHLMIASVYHNNHLTLTGLQRRA